VNIEFLEAMEELAKNEGIERDVLYDAVNEGIKAAYIAEYGTGDAEEDEKFEIGVDIDRNSGDILIKLADKVEEFDLRELGRIATRKAEETIHQEILRYRRDMIFERYHDRVGEIINGSVHRFEGGNVWINLGQAEALLPERERIPGERYQVGSTLRAYLFDVEKTGGDPRLLVSRAHPGFVESLLKVEVPELERGLLKVEAISREPGVRTKVAIRSLSPDIDPVGTCVGPGGTRIKSIVRELHGEKVDMVRWSDDLGQLIENSLSPATVVRINLKKEDQHAQVVVRDDELSLAIGKGGQNVRLTAKLTGFQIDVTSPQELENKEAEAKGETDAESTDDSDAETKVVASESDVAVEAEAITDVSETETSDAETESDNDAEANVEAEANTEEASVEEETETEDKVAEAEATDDDEDDDEDKADEAA
jgi:N utilization substance protein A